MRILTFSFLMVLHCAMYGQWTSITSFNNVVKDFEVFEGEMFIAGNFLQQEGSTCNWSTVYDGFSFDRNSVTIGGSGINKLTTYQGDLLAVGLLTFSFSGGVASWNETSERWEYAYPLTVSSSAMVANGSDLYYGGGDGVVEHFNGSAFTSLPELDDYVADLLFYDGALYAGGAFEAEASGGPALNSVARWDGSTWQPLGDGLGGTVRKLIAYDGALYALGDFAASSSIPATHIARWNGSNWTDVGGSTTGGSGNGMRDALVHGGELYVVGDFDDIGGAPCKDIARWNGSNWTCIGMNEAGSFIETIEVYDGDLYVGMFDFTEAHVYRQSIGTAIEPEHLIASMEVFPNPAHHTLTLRNVSGVPLELAAYAMDGRIVWDGLSMATQQSLDVSEWPRGLYRFVVLQQDGKRSVHTVSLH